MLLICMSIAGTVPLIICLLLLLLQRKKFSYRLGRNLVFLSLAGYLIPFQVVKYLMPTDVLIRTDALANISYYINFDDKGAISYHRISLWMSDWILMIGLCWLFLISGFSVYEIIKYHRLTRKLKKITEKRTCFLPGIGDVEYRISPLIGSPYTIGFLKPFIVAPESLEDSRLSEMIMRHEYSHLRRHDSAVKLLCLLAICLHFYNNIAYASALHQLFRKHCRSSRHRRFHHGGEKSLRSRSRESFRKKQTGSCSLEKQLVGGQTYDEKESGIYYDEE